MFEANREYMYALPQEVAWDMAIIENGASEEIAAVEQRASHTMRFLATEHNMKRVDQQDTPIYSNLERLLPDVELSEYEQYEPEVRERLMDEARYSYWLLTRLLEGAGGKDISELEPHQAKRLLTGHFKDRYNISDYNALYVDRIYPGNAPEFAYSATDEFHKIKYELWKANNPNHKRGV